MDADIYGSYSKKISNIWIVDFEFIQKKKKILRQSFVNTGTVCYKNEVTNFKADFLNSL